MRRFFITALLSIVAVASQSSIAMPPKPAKCPSVNALQYSNFSFAKKQYEGGWTVGDLGNVYDTSNHWTFLLFDIVADNTQNAIRNATKKVRALSFNNGPIAYSMKKRWACVYRTPEGEYAVSYTPIIDSTDI